jgi:MoaA/NifB/PqqE/SkfB family radical SAM enzyme
LIQQRRGYLKIRRDRTGVQVFDRMSGLNLLLDEISVPPMEWARAPRHLAIALTNACDLHCPYCYAPKHNATLDPDTVLMWLTEADKAGCLGVGFGGGEPTTVRWFASLCQLAVQETDLAISFTTHGHRLSDELLNDLAGGVHFVRVSVDGVGEVYERLRRRPFGALVDRLSAVSAIAPFGINVVVNEATVDQLDAVVALAVETGAVEILLLPEQPTARAAGMSNHVGDQLRVWVTRYQGAVKLGVSEQGAGDLPVAEPFADQPSIERYAHIDASGVLRPTSFASSGIEIGADSFLTSYERLLRKEQS